MTALRRYQAGSSLLTAEHMNEAVDELNSRRDVVPVENPYSGAGSSVAMPDEVFMETSRTTSTARVYDPSDSSVYVDVVKCTSVTLKSTAGRVVTFSFSG